MMSLTNAVKQFYGLEVAALPKVTCTDGAQAPEPAMAYLLTAHEELQKQRDVAAAYPLLTRMGLMQLNDLLRCDMTELSRTHNISDDVFQELNGVIAYAADIVRLFAERGERISGILPDVQETPIESLGLGTRTVNAFERFRNKMRNACSGCDKKALCMGGCPLMPEIVFCNSEKDI